MRIFALDLATVTGAALGEAGTVPRSWSFRVRPKGEEPYHAGAGLLRVLTDIWAVRSNIPDLIAFEAPLPIGASKSGEAVLIANSLATAIHIWAASHSIPAYPVSVNDWRKAIIGRARAPGGRETLKDMALSQLKAEGMLPRDCKDDNRGDAVGVWKYAELRWAKLTPAKLIMFGEQPPPVSESISTQGTVARAGPASVAPK